MLFFIEVIVWLIMRLICVMLLIIVVGSVSVSRCLIFGVRCG